MFEVTFVIDGVQRKINVNASDSVTAIQIFTNMYGGFGRTEIINIRRIQEMEEMEEIFNKLDEKNKDILTLVAKGIEIGQQSKSSIIPGRKEK